MFHNSSVICLVLLTFHVVVHNVAPVQVGQSLESAPEDVFGVVHHQLQHGGVFLVLHQEVGEGTVAHLAQVTLQVSTHARHEVVAKVAGRTLRVLFTHHHCLEGEDVVMTHGSKDVQFCLAEMGLGVGEGEERVALEAAACNVHAFTSHTLPYPLNGKFQSLEVHNADGTVASFANASFHCLLGR